MLYVDDIAALWQWRALRNPEQVLSNRMQGFSQEEIPHDREQLVQEMRSLPAALVPWHFCVPHSRYRLWRDAFGYTVRAEVPPGAFCRLNAHVALASPELVFVQMASSLSLAQLVKLGDELCGTYAPIEDEQGKPLTRTGALTTVGRLSNFVCAAHSLRGARLAKKALPFLVEGSASAKETELEMLACLPPRHGGYSIDKPIMNMRVEFDAVARRLAGRGFALCDLCWPEFSLDVEYDSRQFHDSYEGFSSDKARANALNHMGYKVLFANSSHLSDRGKCNSLMCEIAKLAGHRVVRSQDCAEEKRRALFAELRDSASHPVFQTKKMGAWFSGANG